MIVFQMMGIAVAVFLFLFLAFYALYRVFKKEAEPFVDKDKMPLLRPVPIPTRNRNFFMRVLVWIFDVRKWELMENWHFKIKDDSETVEIVVPGGFTFDGASIPRPFRAFLSPVGLLLIPSLIHDYGYRHDQLWEKNDDGEIVPHREKAGRKYWDELFRDIGKEINGFAFVDHIAYLGVRLGGCGKWNEYRKNEKPPVKPSYGFFPNIVKHLPEADIPVEGLQSYLLQGENQQGIFMRFDRDASFPEHAHEAQWGIVLDGEIELLINGTKKTFKKGDTYFIPEDTPHSAEIKAGYRDFTLFNQKDRFNIKEKK